MGLTGALLAALRGDAELLADGAGERRAVALRVQRPALHRTVQADALHALARTHPLPVVVRQSPIVTSFFKFTTESHMNQYIIEPIPFSYHIIESFMYRI